MPMGQRKTNVVTFHLGCSKSTVATPDCLGSYRSEYSG